MAGVMRIASARTIALLACLTFVALAGASSGVTATRSVSDAAIRHALAQRFPQLAVTSVDCNQPAGLCAVVAGKSVFYVDQQAHHLFVGRLYDLAALRDLTAAKLLQVDPERALAGAATADVASPSSLIADTRSTAPPSGGSDARRVDLGSLGPAGEIIWGRPGGTPVTVFTDFRCVFCRALAAELEGMDVRVSERPISVLGSRDIANRVYCAADRPKAVKAAYLGQPLATAGCDTSGLDANERFARAEGFSGTPVIVRADGTVLAGYYPRVELEAWLRGGVAAVAATSTQAAH